MVFCNNNGQEGYTFDHFYYRKNSKVTSKEMYSTILLASLILILGNFSGILCSLVLLPPRRVFFVLIQ